MTGVVLTTDSLEKVSLYTSALPLARELADRDFYDPVHKEVTAFLYDIVNEIRDQRIERLQIALSEAKAIPDGVQRMLAQAKINKQIRRFQGE